MHRLAPVLVLALVPGCELTKAIFEPAGIVLPPEEAAQVLGELAMAPEDATGQQFLAAVRKALDPLPVDSAHYEPAAKEIRVVLGALDDEVLNAVIGSAGSVTTGGWIGIIVGAVGAGGMIVGLAMKKLELMRRAQAAKVAARTEAVA